MSSKPKELLAAETVWKEALRAYKTATAATDAAHKLFREAGNLKDQETAWRLLSRARSAEHTASGAYYKAEHALTSLSFRLEFPAAKIGPTRKNPSRPKRSQAYASAAVEGAAAREAVKLAERDVLEAEPRIAEAAKRYMAGDASAGKSVREASADLSEKHRKLGEARERVRIAEHRYKSIAKKNPAPSSIARGGKKLEELERKLGEASFIWRADKSEKSRRAFNRAMKALETYRREVGINPSIPLENPAPRKLPGQAVLLGEAVELEVISDKGRRRTFKGSGAAALLSDADGDALAIVRPDASKDADPRRGSKDSASTWKKWSGFRVDGALLLTVTDRPLKFSLGRVTVIRYRSDKWTGKAAYYEHKFESKDFHVWADSASSPRAILITAFPPRRLVTARGIVG